MKQDVIKWHETCKCKCRFNSSVCNNSSVSNKQRWNNDKCRCECKELINKVVCNKGFIGILVIVSANVIKPVILVSI